MGKLHLGISLIALASGCCFLNGIDGDFVYDDGAAIVKNKDVSGNHSSVPSISHALSSAPYPNSQKLSITDCRLSSTEASSPCVPLRCLLHAHTIHFTVKSRILFSHQSFISPLRAIKACKCHCIDRPLIFHPFGTLIPVGPVQFDDIWVHDYWGSQLSNESSHKSYRPLTTLTFRADYLAFGLNPKPFHLINIGWHVVVTTLVGSLCHMVLEVSDLASTEAGTLRATWWCAALFGLHPVHVEAVTNIVSRSELLCATFYLLAFFAYRKSSTFHSSATASLFWFVLALLCFGASVLSKETGLTCMGMFIGNDILQLVKNNDKQRRLQVGMVIILGAIQYVTLLALVALYLWYKRELTQDHFMPKISALDNCAYHAPGTVAVILSYLQIHSVYLWKLVFPHTLSCDYSRNVLPPIQSVKDPENWRWMLAYGILLIIITYSLRLARRKETALLECLLWLAVPFGLASNILFPVATVVGERLLYIPSIGFCLFCALVYQKATSAEKAPRVLSTVLDLVLLGVCGLYAMKTWERNVVWASTIDLFKEHTKIVPNSVRMHHGLAAEYSKNGNYSAALPYYKSAVKLLADKTFNKKMSEDQDDYKQTLSQYYFEWATALDELGRQDEAIKHYNKATTLKPEEYRYWNRLAFALVQTRQYDKGFDAFFKCYTLRPAQSDMVNNLGNVYMATGRMQDAIRTYKLARRISPTDSECLYNMGVLFLRTGNTKLGYESLVQASRLNPSDLEVRKAALAAKQMYNSNR